MEFSLPSVFLPVDQILPIAKAADEAGFTRIVLPDSLFYPEDQALDYPYTPDGSRMWDENTPWTEALTIAAAMAAVTESIRFCPQVLKLGPRSPLLLSRQIGTVANVSNNRLDMGVGIGWDPNEFEWCGVPFSKRGKRVDEMIDILQQTLAGGWVEYHGEHFDFGRLQISPAPSERVPFYVGGHTEIALKRAARVGDGWTSAMMTYDDIVKTVARLDELLPQYGKTRADRGDGKPYAVQVVCLDKFGKQGYEELDEAGVTDIITVPWLTKGIQFDDPVEPKVEAIFEFAQEYGLKNS